MALRVFTSARAALETARGTTTTPTRIIYADEFTHEQDVATIRPTQLVGSYSGVRSASAGKEVNRFRMAGTLSYDDAAWFGQLFFKGGVTATGANPYVWTFLPTNTSDDLKSLEVQCGFADTIGTTPAVKLNYVLGETMTWHWEKSDVSAVTFDASFLSASVANQITAFTGSLSDRSVTLASSSNTTVYSDPGGGTIGATADDSVIAVDWTLNLNPTALYTLNASNAATAVYRPQHRTWTATITKQYENDTFWDDYQDKTTQKIRVKTTTGASAIIQVDLYGTYTGRTLSEVDGIITEELTLENIWDTSSSSDFNVVITNTVATIT